MQGATTIVPLMHVRLPATGVPCDPGAHDARVHAVAAIRTPDGKDCKAAATNAAASENTRPLDPQPVIDVAHAGAARDDVLDRVADARLGDGAIDAHPAVVD